MYHEWAVGEESGAFEKSGKDPVKIKGFGFAQPSWPDVL